MSRSRGLTILLAGQAMASMDSSILVVAAPSLRDDLHATGGELQLVVVMYTLAFAALVVAGARLGDVIGPRRAFLMGLAGFSLASLLGGLAPDPATLIVARALQGAAGAVMTPQVLSIIQREYAGAARVRALSAYSLILAVGVAAGQVVGGLLVSAHLLEAAWRPALLLNAPVGAALLLAARRGLAPAGPVVPRRRVDTVGGAILGVAMLALVLPVTTGPLAGLLVLPLLAVAFVRYEHHVARDPIFDLALLRSRVIAAGTIAVLTIMGSYAGFLLTLTLHLQGDLGYSAIRAGLTFAVYAAGFATASLTWARLPTRDALPTLGPLAMAGGMLAAGALGPSPLGLAALAVAGAGHAFGYAPLTARLAECVAPDQAADLSGLLLTASLVGSVLGTTAIGAIYLATGSLVRATAVVAATLLVTSAAAILGRAAPATGLRAEPTRAPSLITPPRPGPRAPGA